MITFYAIKNLMTGEYHSTGNSGSSAPATYLSKGKAEARRKQLYDGRHLDWSEAHGKYVPVKTDWKVVKWNIQEEICED